MDITYRLSQELGVDLTPLLDPERLILAADILAKRHIVPAAAGIYGWWFDKLPLGIPLHGSLQKGSHHLLYVGIAPRKPIAAGIASKSNLRKRIVRNHLGARIGSSTLRRSLAHLLKEELGLSISRVGKKDVMSRSDELTLTGWIVEHAALSYLPIDRAWELESLLVTEGSLGLALNVKGSETATARTLMRIRSLPQRGLG